MLDNRQIIVKSGSVFTLVTNELKDGAETRGLCMDSSELGKYGQSDLGMPLQQ